MGNAYNIDQIDCIEGAVYIFSPTSENIDLGYSASCKAPCKAPCKSCGGGCYGCKGSKGAEIPISYSDESSGLVDAVKEVLD